MEKHGKAESRVRSYEEGEGVEQLHHEILVDGVVVWSDWIMDDGTGYWTGEDMTKDINDAHEKYGLPAPYRNR